MYTIYEMCCQGFEQKLEQQFLKPNRHRKSFFFLPYLHLVGIAIRKLIVQLVYLRQQLAQTLLAQIDQFLTIRRVQSVAADRAAHHTGIADHLSLTCHIHSHRLVLSLIHI